MKNVLCLSLFLTACGQLVEVADAGLLTSSTDDGGQPDAGLPDAGTLDAGHKADGCASAFGSAFTDAFGRADGIVTAVVPPAWKCPLENGDHVVVQMRINGEVQRLVVNVLSSFGDPRIRFRTHHASLPPPVYEEGWHPGLALDFMQMGLHSDAGWEALEMEVAATRIYDAIIIGEALSVYATSSGGSFAASAHKIHRNGRNNDGAIVVAPTSSSPTWLLFHFANQVF